MNGAEWYYAQIRWAVMVDGKEGLRHWEEAVHIFLSDDRDTAFRRALEIGHQAEHSHDEGRRWVESRLAQIVKLDCLGANQTEFQVGLGSFGNARPSVKIWRYCMLRSIRMTTRPGTSKIRL